MHFSSSVENIRRSPFQALAAIFTLALTFFVGTLLAITVFASHRTVTYFETRPQVIAFLTNDATVAEIERLRTRLETDQRVATVRFVSKEQALEIYRSATTDNPLLGELVSPSVFPASIEFSVRDLSFAQEIVDEVSQETIVDSVGFTASVGGESGLSDVITRLKNIVASVRIGGGVLVGVLAANSFLVLTVLMSLRITTRRRDINTLSLIGASGWFVRAPVLMEAVIYAFLGAFIGWFFGSLVALISAPPVVRFFGDVPVLPRDNVQFLLMLTVILAIEIATGIVIALLGSSFAVSRALRRSNR